MNDQTAQMGFQVGQKAVMAGQEYMEQSVCHITTKYSRVFRDLFADSWIPR